MKKIIFSFGFLLIIASISKAEIPKEAVQLRDDPLYFQRIRGIHRPNTVKPTHKNIDDLVSNGELVYRDYLRELYKGFITEDNGDLSRAAQHYKKCLSITVHEEQSYYTNIDLARISLKLGKITDAISYLQQYLRYMEQEIKAGEGRLTEIFFGYVPSGESLIFMKQEYKKLSIILESLKRSSQK